MIAGPGCFVLAARTRLRTPIMWLARGPHEAATQGAGWYGVADREARLAQQPFKEMQVNSGMYSDFI